jgi:hypothetical protein
MSLVGEVTSFRRVDPWTEMSVLGPTIWRIVGGFGLLAGGNNALKATDSHTRVPLVISRKRGTDLFMTTICSLVAGQAG